MAQDKNVPLTEVAIEIVKSILAGFLSQGFAVNLSSGAVW